MSIKTCRLCLNDDSFSLNLFSDESRSREVLHKIKFCIPVVKISNNDSDPRHICFKCLSTLDTMSEFMKKCVSSESILKRSSQSPPDEVEIMNLSVCSGHSRTGKYSCRQSKVKRPASFTSSRDSSPERAIWGRGNNSDSPCCEKLSGGAPMHSSAAKKRNVDTLGSFSNKVSPSPYIHPPNFGGGVQAGRKPEANQLRPNSDIFTKFSHEDEDEEDCDKFLSNFWRDEGAPAKPQSNSSTLPDKDCKFQFPSISAADTLTTKNDAKATEGPPCRASGVLGHIIDNWKPMSDKVSCGLDRSQILDCVNH